MLEKFLIYTKTIDYIVWLFPVINTFPKAQRFVLGQQLEASALRFLEQVIRSGQLNGSTASNATVGTATILIGSPEVTVLNTTIAPNTNYGNPLNARIRGIHAPSTLV